MRASKRMRRRDVIGDRAVMLIAAVVKMAETHRENMGILNVAAKNLRSTILSCCK